MGRMYLFECKKCGYHTSVAGGLSEGYDLKGRTMVCSDCRSIYDCVIALRAEAETLLGSQLSNLTQAVAPSLQSALARLPLSTLKGSHWREFEPVCPVDATHRVAPWSTPGRCPRCKAYLESGALPYCVWN